MSDQPTPEDFTKADLHAGWTVGGRWNESLSSENIARCYLALRSEQAAHAAEKAKLEKYAAEALLRARVLQEQFNERVALLNDLEVEVERLRGRERLIRSQANGAHGLMMNVPGFECADEVFKTLAAIAHESWPEETEGFVVAQRLEAGDHADPETTTEATLARTMIRLGELEMHVGKVERDHDARIDAGSKRIDALEEWRKGVEGRLRYLELKTLGIK